VLLKWRNNSATQEASHNTALINEDEHILWLKRILASENRKLYVAEIDSVPVGTVRVDFEALGYELSWTVSNTMRGSGIGKAMVSQLAKDIPESIRAEIKIGNVASIRIAEDTGMAFEREEKGVLHYRRDAVAQPAAEPERPTA
jgi:RimJ/RimL family protein N-acetyltransferase